MPEIRAVLFDFFGTLTQAVRRGPEHDRIALSLGCDPAAFRAVLDGSFYIRASGRFGSAEASLRWVCEQTGGLPSSARLRAAVDARVRLIRAEATLRADAVDTLQRLRRRGVHTGLISDCSHELPLFLPDLPISPLLDAVAYSVEVGCCKPDPQMYLTACDQLGLPPDACWYVGDGGSRELSGAARAGLTAVRLAATDLTGHLVFDPDTGWIGPEAASLTEVADLVEVSAGTAGCGV